MKNGKEYSVLKNCIYDDNATRSYDIMRGGFIWSDEFPHDGELHVKLCCGIGLLAEVIAYRASLTAGSPRTEFEEHWNSLISSCPSWPGLRKERIYGQIERDYKAVKLKEKRCFNSDEFLNDDDI